jgi:hypothetical protein
MRDLIFLIYLNRSGSTLLANQASAHPSICVCPEAHQPIRRLLGQMGPRMALSERLDRLVAETKIEPKLSSWGLDSALLRQRLEGSNDDIEAFYRLLDAYAETHAGASDQVMVKGLFLLQLMRQHGLKALQRGRKVRAIILFRDPRSIMSSQYRNVSSTSGTVMQDSAFALAMRWRTFLKQAKQFEGEQECLFVRYEDWIGENDRQKKRLFETLGLSDVTGGRSTLVSRIPEGQKHLHAKIGSAPDTSRIEAWRDELSSDHRMIIEGIAGKQLQSMGYPAPEPVSVGRLLGSVVPDALRWVIRKVRRG